MKIVIKILFPIDFSLPDTATLRIELRDVSLIDAPSRTLLAIDSPVTSTKETTIEIDNFQFPHSTPRKHLNVWGHLSLHGKDTVNKGDLLTTRAYTIPGETNDCTLSIQLDPV